MVKDPYEKTAKKYDQYVEPAIAVLRQIGLQVYPPKEGMLVLDVGCGTGTNLKLYQEAGCNVFGVDLSPEMVEAARTKLGKSANICLCNAVQMPYRKRRFDLVTGFLTFHEMPGQIHIEVLGEMIRVMKREGRILLIDYHPGPLRFPKGWMYKMQIVFFEILAGWNHFRNYRDFLSKKGFLQLIEAKNLNIVKEKIVSGGNVVIYLLSS
jgi:ubiquinone/menaquinone biosynthesis C-methylase UbiE